MKYLRRAAILLFALVLIGAILFRLSPPEFRGHRLFNAAAYGNTLSAKLFILLGADVNYTFGSGTPLHAAAANGDVTMMKLLLDHGAVVDKPAKFDITPLFEARAYKHPEAEKLLLSHGANPDTSHIHPP